MPFTAYPSLKSKQHIKMKILRSKNLMKVSCFIFYLKSVDILDNPYLQKHENPDERKKEQI